MDSIKLVDDQLPDLDASETSQEFLAEARAWIKSRGIGGAIFLILIWPLMTVPWGVFDPAIFSLWSSIAFMWGYTGTFVIVLLPIYEQWDVILAVFSGMFGME